MIETKPQTNFKFSLIFVIIVLSLIVVYATRPLQRPDEDCIEWGVEVEYPDKTKAWANTSYDPRSREEAERMAKQMEMEDVKGNRYYTAKCRRYK